jgi:hypothetical protein
METLAVTLTSESLRDVPIPVGDKYFDLNVCGETFSLPISKIYFIAPILAHFFLCTRKVLDICIEDSDKDNALFKGISEESVVESFKILISLLNGIAPSLSETLYSSLLFLATKLGCLDLFQSLDDFHLSHFTQFTFSPSLFSFGSSHHSRSTNLHGRSYQTNSRLEPPN